MLHTAYALSEVQAVNVLYSKNCGRWNSGGERSITHILRSRKYE